MNNLIPKLHKVHPTCLIVNYGLQGGQKVEGMWNDIIMYGPGEGGFEESLVPNHIRNFNGDCLISIFDTWAWRNLHNELKNNRIPWIPYTPVDGHDLNPNYISQLQTAFKIIPMSKHSEDCLKKYFPEKTLPHIPPGVDLSIFYPRWEKLEEKNKLKRDIGFSEDTFVIMIAGDIKGFRRRWAENLEGIKIFKDRHPELKLGIFIHTNLRALSGLDFNVKLLAEKFGLSDITRMTDPYGYVAGVSHDYMAHKYSLSDVFLQASYGDGFGMMAIESAAVGTPSIGTDFSSTPQVVIDGKTGHLVRSLFNAYDQSLSRKALPDPIDIADKLDLVLKNGSISYREECVKHSAKFEWNKVITEQWLPTLKQLEQDIYLACQQPPDSSEKLKENAQKIFTL